MVTCPVGMSWGRLYLGYGANHQAFNETAVHIRDNEEIEFASRLSVQHFESDQVQETYISPDGPEKFPSLHLTAALMNLSNVSLD